jgi:type II secretory pathway component PulF
MSRLRMLRRATTILLVGLVVCTLVIAVALPSYVHMFQRYHVNLSEPVRIMLGIGEFARSWRSQVVLVVVAFIAGGTIFVWAMTEAGPAKSER